MPKFLLAPGLFDANICAPKTQDPIVQWSRTLPFHGSNTGSNPVRVAGFLRYLHRATYENRPKFLDESDYSGDYIALKLRRMERSAQANLNL